ncbi:MAG: restriction endonuclease subunit R, partial [Ectothiorhodospiraceae bacterium]|nr:restriction endonuclease subunit R [Ectothiorhodospiraceae bacterium]
MMEAPRPEWVTQNRVIKLFESLGYHYLGDWHTRVSNSNIEEEILRENLTKRGYEEVLINAAIGKLHTTADTPSGELYTANKNVYRLLRYGAKVRIAVDATTETVELIDWDHPEQNDFAIAEEVTLKGNHTRRPDLVLYINGIAVGVIELKRSSHEIGDGVRQVISNQTPEFNEWFYSTVQLVFAGNDSQGLRYGTTLTPEQYFVEWKNDPGSTAHTADENSMDAALEYVCNKDRMLDIVRNCTIFDAGKKKIPRPHQYFGLKAAQERIKNREGGVIWHTQGSGKSILMVMLAKWIMEHDPEGRVLIITDRDELDKQIVGVMRNAGVIGENDKDVRMTSRKEFIDKLGDTKPRLLCALIHKFDTKKLEGPKPDIHGRFYIFVDECHRTQGGYMNKLMKRW